MSRTTCLLAASLVALVPAVAAAAPQASAFEPSKTWRPTEFPFESPYVPATGPLRVKIGAVAFQEVDVAMAGEANYDFDGGMLEYEGREAGGSFRNTLGAEITLTISIAAFGIETELELGIWDISELAELTFDPYVLPGNPARPITLAESIGPNNLVDAPIQVLGAPANVNIDYMFEVPGISFAGEQIDLDGAVGDAELLASHTQEHEQRSVAFTDAEPGDTVSAWATMRGSFSSALTLHVYPTVEIQVLGQPIAIGPLDIAIEYPVVSDEPVAFDDIELQYHVPEMPAPDPDPEPEPDPDSSGDGDGGDASSSDGGDDDATTSGGDTTGGAGSGLGVGEDASGCGCTSDRNGAGFAGVMLLGALGLRRRRR